METAELHHDIRALITTADHLSRRAYAANRERDAEVFASLRTALQRIDRWLGAAHVHPGVNGEVDLFYQRVRDAAARASAENRAEMAELVTRAEHVHDSVAPPKLLVKKLPDFLRGVD
jgi:hypothetical protein